MAMSEEQRKAASERMRAMHAKKKAEKAAAEAEVASPPTGTATANTSFSVAYTNLDPTVSTVTYSPGTANPNQGMVTMTQEQLNAILERLQKVEAITTTSSPVASTTQVAQDGRIFGIQTPYPLSPDVYKDPRETLYNLPILEQYGFKKNYRLDWLVEVQNYETKFGTSFSVPKFKLKLRRIMLDEETGEPITFEKDGKTYERGYLVQAGIFFVDPAECVAVARDLGIPIDNANSPEFLEAMRMEMYKRWLLECMKPPKPQPSKGQKQIVVGGHAYIVEEWNQNA